MTCPGFYGPQYRQLRAPLASQHWFADVMQVQLGDQVITNLEMETSAIYGMARLLGHDACSVNTILANRPTKTFSKDPDKSVDQMIQTVLATLA